MTLEQIVKKAKIAGNGNIKLGDSMGTFSKLMGNDDFYIPKLNMAVCGSCGHHCVGCKKDRYVKKSYRYDSVKYGHALRSIAVSNALDELTETLSKQLARKKKPFRFVRINQSGELETLNEFLMWARLAKEQPETDFYLYTKALEIVIPYLKEHGSEIPKNLTILVSIWHEYGIDEFNAVKHLPNVKAFVYLDGFDYESHGIVIQTKCNAYVGTKLNKEITCEKCQKCMDRLSCHKIIGCDAH